MIFNVLNVFYNIRKTPDFSGFPVILPNPNRITTMKRLALHHSMMARGGREKPS